MMREFLFESQHPDDTRRMGRTLGRIVTRRLVVALSGTLGAGKTAFVRAVAEGLGVSDPRVVTSPTFVLIQEYEGRLPIYHFDACRLKDSSEFADLGPEEYFQSEGLCLIEWADRVEFWLPSERLDIHFTVTGQEQRAIRAVCVGDRHLQLLGMWWKELESNRSNEDG